MFLEASNDGGGGRRLGTNIDDYSIFVESRRLSSYDDDD